MRFFTRAWHAGSMDEAEAAEVPERYAAHLAALAPGLDPSVRDLADADLHDAWILEAEPRGARLWLRLRIGDLQRGYSDLTLTYDGVSERDKVLSFLGARRRPADVDLLYDEIDREDAGRLVHRLLFWPYAEVDIAFSRLLLQVKPVSHRSDGGAV